MPTLTMTPEEIVADWRRSTDQPEGMENPAGPLFTGDGYTESEITMTGGMTYGGGPTCGTACTGSYCYYCC